MSNTPDAPDDVLDPEDPENPVNRRAERTKAARIRLKVKAGTATVDDLAYLHDYDQGKQQYPGRPPGVPQTPPRGGRAARGHRRVSYTEEESAAAAEGDSAVVAAAMGAAVAREEGRREDSLADRGIAALERAFHRQEKMVEFFMARMEMLEHAHLELLTTNRELRIRQTDAEIALMEAESQQKDDINEAAQALLPALLKQLNKGTK
jgi:uncharacterized small protein (DUF1192 family)